MFILTNCGRLALMGSKSKIHTKENDPDELQLRDETDAEWVNLWRNTKSSAKKTTKMEAPMQIPLISRKNRF